MPDEFVEALFQPGALTSARDVMIVTWLHDGGIRVGGLCGLRFSDLHLIQHHPCGQRAEPHIHIVGRDDIRTVLVPRRIEQPVSAVMVMSSTV